MKDPTSLQNLHDILIPYPVPFWPPAPGWYVLGAVVVIGIVWVTWRWFQSWRANRYRREALAELDRLEISVQDDFSREAALRGLPELVKRTALAGLRRDHVASLSGKAWLEFLDQTGSTDAFTQGPGSLLLDFSYQTPSALERISEKQIKELVSLIRKWIKTHGFPLIDN